MNETDYVRVLMARTSVELRDHRLFRRNVGAVKLEDRVFRAGIPGQADVYVLGRGGWHGEIECKRFSGLSETQVRWRDWCLSWQIPWLLLEVRKAELPLDTIQRWMLELREWLRDQSS